MRIRLEPNSQTGNHRFLYAAAFSLIEVLVAVVVVGTSAVAMFSGINSGFFTMQLARENLRATQIMLEKTETLRLYSWDQVTPSFIPTNFTAYYDPNSTNTGLTYRGGLAIENSGLGTSYASNMKKITVTLNWETRGLSRTRSFTTYVSRSGLQSYVY